eukprot:361131-Chlamydomonas_euryale.AAC.2
MQQRAWATKQGGFSAAGATLPSANARAGVAVAASAAVAVAASAAAAAAPLGAQHFILGLQAQHQRSSWCRAT